MLGGGARFDKRRFKEDIEVFQVLSWASSLHYVTFQGKHCLTAFKINLIDGNSLKLPPQA